MRRKYHSPLMLAVLVVCTTASAQTYEMRAPLKSLVVQGSPSSSTGSSMPTTPPPPAPVYNSQLSAQSLDFGGVAVGQPGVQSFGVLNTGNQPLSLGSITASGPAFSAVTSCAATLAPGAQCPVQVTFQPVAGQAYSGTVTVNSNATNSPQVVTLAGTGLQARVALTVNSSSDFGQVGIGQSSSRTFTLTNNGNTPATNVVASLTGSSGLALTSNTCGTSAAPAIVQAGGTCTMTVTYTPTVTETLNNASLNVAANAVGSPAAQSLTGSAVVKDPYWANVTYALHMDGANGTNSFVDAKGHSFTAAGTPTISTAASKFGGASAYLNGSSSLQTGYSSGMVFTGDFTVELWANVSAHASYGGLIAAASTSSWNGWQIIFDQTSNNLRVEASGQVAMVSSTSLPMNTWAHIALVRQGTGTNNVRLYLNGAQVAALTYTGAFDSGGAPLHIGTERTACCSITGFIDDVRITAGVARYTGNFTPPTTAFPNQ